MARRCNSLNQLIISELHVDLASAGGHFEEESVFTGLDCALDGVDGLLLVLAKETQFVQGDEVGTLSLVLPCSLRLVSGALSENDKVPSDRFIDETLRIRLDVLVDGNRLRCRERGDDVRVAALQVPEIVQVAIRQDHEAAILRLGILPCLLLANKRVLVFRLGFEHDEREALLVEQEEVDEAIRRLLEVLAEAVKVALADFDCLLKLDIGGFSAFREEAPACRF